jgi:creatinine amidohydrolase
VRFELMTWPEVKDAIDRDLPVILPVGSIEQHGPHMPLGTDSLVPHALAMRVADRRPAIVMPPIMYAAYSRPRSGGGRTFPGSIGVRGATLEAVITQIVDDLMRLGHRRIAVLNGHFENQWNVLEGIENAIRGREATHRALLIAWWDQIFPEDIDRIFGDAFPGWEREHASLTETSLMEALHPELVRSELKAEGGAERILTYESLPTPADTIWPTGVGYSAIGASAELGEELASLVVDRVDEILGREFGPAGHESPALPAANQTS